jgi:WD40 repeat protein
LEENPVVEDFPLDIELETEQLYQELANMSLNNYDRDGNTLDDQDAFHGDVDDPFSWDPSEIPTGTDGLPFYLWCQPCGAIGLEETEQSNEGHEFPALDPALPPITEDQPLDEVESEIVRQAQEHHIKDLQELYMASQRQKHGFAVTEDGGGEIMQLDRNDPLLQELEAKADAAEIPDWQDAAQEYARAFGVDMEKKGNDTLTTSVPVSTKDTSVTCLGHKETIYSVSFKSDGKYIATAGQDSTINVWETASHRLLTSLEGHNTNYECLRVDWASPEWADEVLDRSERFSNIIASSGADGVVKLWTCADPKGAWKCEFTLDHAKLLARGIKNEKGETSADASQDDDWLGSPQAKDDGDKPQIYALKFIDHWRVFTNNVQEQCRHTKAEEVTKQAEQNDQTLRADNGDKNSFLMTSSDEFIHLWEVEPHPYDQQLKLDDHRIRLLQDNQIKLKEVMSLHFGSLEQYGFGVTPCSVTGEGLKLPPPPRQTNDTAETEGGRRFGGDRNPQNIIFVFDADYCPATGLLGVALSDGSLRLVNGRGICISVLNLPGNQSHLTSFCWDSTGNRLATTVATGHLITWALDMGSHHGGNENTVATCTAIFEGGHEAGRPLFGARFCGEDEKLLLSWGVDGRLCLWGSHSQGNIYAPIAVLKQDPDYPIYTLGLSERTVAVGGGSNGGFIGIPLYLFDLPKRKATHQAEKTPHKKTKNDDNDYGAVEKSDT